MRKSHFNDEFLLLLGPIISRLFRCSNEEKIKKKTKGACSGPILYDHETSYSSMLDIGAMF
jgi:hypothetical protein